MSGIIGGTKARGSGIINGNIDLIDKILQRPEIKDYGETVNAIGSTASSQAIDLSLGNVVTATMAQSTTTFSITNPSASGKCCSFTLILTQDGSGSRAVAWPPSVKWPGDTAPTISTGASKVDILSFITVDAGTNWYGFEGGIDLR